MTSYRAELAGLHKVLLALIKTNLNEKEIELWCNSESAVGVLNKPEVKATKDLFPQFFNIAIKHVKGHQIKHASYENLPFEAQLSEDCDTAAKETMRNQPHSETRPNPIEGSRATLYLDNKMITTDIKRSISHACINLEVRCICCRGCRLFASLMAF